MPSITATLAANISKKQTDNFYFTILFASDHGTIDSDSFTLANIQITGTTDFTVANAFTLLYPVQSNFVLIAVDLPDNVDGDFVIDLIGSVTIGGTSYDISAASKYIEYDTVGSRSGDTYDITDLPSEASELKVTVSTRSIRNGGIIIANFDFNYGIPYFSSSYVTVSAGATKSNAEVIDDHFRRWIMLVTAPTSGTGEVEITVDEDAVGFSHAAARAQVQHSENPTLTITEPVDADGNPTIQPVKGMAFERIFTVMGDNVNYVNITGILEEIFYHSWDASTGKLYLRSKGKLDDSYDDFEVYVEARDDGGMNGVAREHTYESFLTTPAPMAPAVVVPSSPLEFFYGQENEVEIEILRIDTVSVRNLKVRGTFLGIGFKKSEKGVQISGDIPARGSAIGEMLPALGEGEFEVEVTGPGGKAPLANVPWVLIGDAKPIFSDQAFTDYTALNLGITDTIKVTGYPRPTISVESGSLPTGLTLETAETSTTVTTISFSGTATVAGTFTFKLKAENSEGVTISSQYSVTVYTGLVAPTLKRAFPARWGRRTGSFPMNVQSRFNLGTPEGVFSLGSGSSSLFSITAEGVVSLTGTPLLRTTGTRYDLIVVLENSEGRVSSESSISFSS